MTTGADSPAHTGGGISRNDLECNPGQVVNAGHRLTDDDPGAPFSPGRDVAISSTETGTDTGTVSMKRTSQLLRSVRDSDRQISILNELDMHKAFFNFLDNIRPNLSAEGDKVCNMALSILGPGVLSIPYALKSSGLVLGMFMFAVGALINVYTANLLLVDVKRLTKGLPLTFENMASDTYGKACKEFLRWNLLILLFGFVCGNVVTVGPLAHKLLSGWGVQLSEPTILGGICAFILTPMALIPDIGALGKYSSPIGVVSLITLVVVVVMKFFSNPNGMLADGVKISMVKFDSSMLLTGPIASFAFNLQPYIFPVFYEDENKVAKSHRRNSKQKRISEYADALEDVIDEKNQEKEKLNKNIVYMAMGISFVIYMTAGVFGYLQFGEDTDPFILLNYKNGDEAKVSPFATTLVYLVTIISVVVIFPLNVFPLRELIDQMVVDKWFPELEDVDDTFSWSRHVPETVFIIVAAFGVAIMPGIDVGIVFGITGATACTVVAYALPCAFSAKLCPAGWSIPLIATVVTSMIVGALYFVCMVPGI